MKTPLLYFVLIIFFSTSILGQINLKEKIDTVDAKKLPVEFAKNSKPMIVFFLKYDDSTKTPNQNDFDIMITEMGLMDKVKNDKSGLTKEDAFNFVNAYINTDKNKKGGIDIDENKKEKIRDYLIELNEGKQKAENIFKNATTDDKMKKMVEDAQTEVKKIKLNPNPLGITYEQFKKVAKEKKPNMSETEIKKAYDDLIKQFSS